MTRVSARILASALCLALFSLLANAEPASEAANASVIPAALEAYSGASKECLASVEKASSLAGSGKWRSAYLLLAAFDPENQDPFALAMKISLVLRGELRSERHRAFALADLDEGQSVEALRRSAGDYELFAFDPPVLAAALASSGAAKPGILSKELGDYYCDLLSRFSGQWFLGDEELLALAIAEYAEACAAGACDEASLARYADALVRADRAEEALPVYRRAIGLDGADGALRYGYARCLVYLRKNAEALPEIDAAIAASGAGSQRLDAIALGARAASELGDELKAESYFALAEKSSPGSAAPGLMRHMIAVETGRKAAADAAADGLVPLFGFDPAVVRALLSTWYAGGDAPSARAFLERNIAKDGDDLTLGVLEFYLAVVLLQDSPSAADKASALEALGSAETRLKAGAASGLAFGGPDEGLLATIAGMKRSLASEGAEGRASN